MRGFSGSGMFSSPHVPEEGSCAGREPDLRVGLTRLRSPAEVMCSVSRVGMGPLGRPLPALLALPSGLFCYSIHSWMENGSKIEKQNISPNKAVGCVTVDLSVACLEPAGGRQWWGQRLRAMA